MKRILLCIVVCIFSFFGLKAQDDSQRLKQIENQLVALSVDNPGLTEQYKSDIAVNRITLNNFLLAISNLHKVNINVSPELENITITNNFSSVTVSDILLFLCKEYNLTIDFTGNILSIKTYQRPLETPEKRIIPIVYFPNNDHISMDVKGDKLYDVFKRISEESGKNLVFSPGLENKVLTAYIQDSAFDVAMENLAFSNNLYVEKTKNGFYQFEDNATPTTASTTGSNTQQAQLQRPIRRRGSNFDYKILSKGDQLLEVDFKDVPIVDVVETLGTELEIDMFTASPLDNAGTTTFKAKSIYFDQLLTKIFEVQAETASGNNPSVQNFNGQNQNVLGGTNRFIYKKEDGIYYFGTEKQLSVRKVEIIPLHYRSIELQADPQSSGTGLNRMNSIGNSFGNSTGFDNVNRQYSNNSNQSNYQNQNNLNNRQNQVQQNKVSLIELIPKEITNNLEIVPDYELNSFYVVGPSSDILRFKSFVTNLDKPVPVILIEVMIIEVSKSYTLEAGVEWGLAESPTQTQGGLFPETNVTLGAETINNIIGGFNSFAGVNLGKVVNNFTATIRAMEANGDLKVRSTPKIATLNGHRATFSNGQTSYYGITQRNIYGTDNPQTTEFTNYYPIDVALGLVIKPSVTADNKVILDIFVEQSSFGQRISDEAPPDINSRYFTSLISMENGDLAILGGLEENYSNDSGNGVPLLARVPIIKWLFSKRVREGKKAKLTVLIKPTIIN